MGREGRVHFITTLHVTDITLVGADRSYLPITRFSIEQSDGVTAVSNYLKERTVREFEITRPIEVIPNFVNCDTYHRLERPAQRDAWAADGEPVLMHLSNFRAVKRVLDVVEIFALVREKVRAKLVLMGDGPERGGAEWLVRRKGLCRDVHFLGKQDQVQEKLGQADLFLLPSDLESFGLAALEAMACEVPVIATNVGGLPEVVTHGVEGFLVPPRDVVAAAQYALELLASPERRREMGKQARKKALASYCASKIIPLYEAYYRRVTELASAAPA
jgi:N-acetyl-alpha-D-glucosaminyl L-malate synthase BshA